MPAHLRVGIVADTAGGITFADRAKWQLLFVHGAVGGVADDDGIE